jgi:hypothetical protein
MDGILVLCHRNSSEAEERSGSKRLDGHVQISVWTQ